MNSSYNKWNPPPVPPTNNKSINVSAAEITSFAASTPSNPYKQGLPIQFVNQFGSSNDVIHIDYNETPFTYLNISNVAEDGTSVDPSEFILVTVEHVPLGTVFIINGPTSWVADKGILAIIDRDSSGNLLPNAILEVDPRGEDGSLTAYVNIMVARDETGFVARAMS